MNLHPSLLSSVDRVHLPCPLETIYDMQVWRRKLMYKGGFKCINSSDGRNKKGGRWRTWRWHKDMNLRHLGRSLTPFTERMAIPQNASMIIMVPKERHNILFTLHSSMSIELSGQKNWEVLSSTGWIFFPVLEKFCSEYSLKTLTPDTSFNYVCLVLHTRKFKRSCCSWLI